MSRSQNKSAFFGFLFICFVNVVIGVPYGESPRFFCEVNGKFYHEGERFPSMSNPDLVCRCQRGFTGRNVEAFCNAVERPVEHDNFNQKNQSQSMDDCVRITRNNESPKYTHYTEHYRCPNDEATIPVSITQNLKYARDDRSICTFGEHKYGIGDYFYHSMMQDTRNCVKCTCERPPKPTCVRPPSCPLVYVGPPSA